MVVESKRVATRFDVVLVSNGFQTEYEVGFANGLARLGLRPVLVCSDKLPIDRLDLNVATINLRGSQRSDRSKWAKTLNILAYWRALLFMLRTQPKPCVHLIGLFTLPSAWASFAEAIGFRFSAHHFVLTVHNLLPHDAHSRLNHLLYGAIYRLAHTLVVHTPRMRDRLQGEFGISTNRIVVMEHGIDRLMYRHNTDVNWLACRLDLPPGRPVMLFFGAVARYKGLDTLVEILLASSTKLDAVLVVAGQCRDTGLRQALTPGLQRLISENRARWVDGFVPDEDVVNYFHGADLLVMPYRHIDQSGVVFMALSTGLPVVATDVGSLADYIPLTGGCIVPVEDDAALLAGISKVLASTIGQDRDARVDAARRFLWSETVRSVLHAYRDTP